MNDFEVGDLVEALECHTLDNEFLVHLKGSMYAGEIFTVKIVIKDLIGISGYYKSCLELNSFWSKNRFKKYVETNKPMEDWL